MSIPHPHCPRWCNRPHRLPEPVVIHQARSAPWVSADGSAHIERMTRQYDDGPPLLALRITVDGGDPLELEMTPADARVAVSELLAGMRSLAGPALAG